MLQKALLDMHPLRRTHSLPGRCSGPVRCLNFPPALAQVCLVSGRRAPPPTMGDVPAALPPRRRTPVIDKQETASPAEVIPASASASAHVDRRQSSSIEETGTQSSVDGGPGPSDSHRKLRHSPAAASAEDAEHPSTRDMPQPSSSSLNSSSSAVNATLVLPFDGAKAQASGLWAMAWRGCADCVPPGVGAFAEEVGPRLRANPPPSSPSPSPSPRQQRRSAGPPGRPLRGGGASAGLSRDRCEKRQLSSSRSSVDGGNCRGGAAGTGPPTSGGVPSSSGPLGGAGGKDALLAIQRWGETHAASAIPVTLAHRERGLFGEAKQKELYQMVISILNKVTNDTEKFNEVKNALLRLPIPEANSESLEKVIRVFLKKAILEPHFSQLYAQLMQHLCRGPASGRATASGASTPCPSSAPSRSSSPAPFGSSPPPPQSLEVRVGRGVVDLCLQEFQSLVERTNGTVNASEDDLKLMRDRLCGTVRFAFELHDIDFIRDQALTDLFLTCCTGDVKGEIATPPTYTPSEAQMSALLAMLQYVGKSSYFQSATWTEEMAPRLTPWLNYWLGNYPVSRIRFLLMSATEKLKGHGKEEDAPAPPQPLRQPVQATTPGAIYIAGSGGISRPASRASSRPASPPAAPEPGSATTTTTPASSSPGPGPSPAPAPTSTRASGSAALVVHSLTPAPPTPAPAPPPEYDEYLAKLPQPKYTALLLALCSKGQVTLPALVRDLVSKCLPHLVTVLETWVARALTVVKESWARDHIGPLVCTILREAPPSLGLDATRLAEVIRQVVRSKWDDYDCVPGFFHFYASMVLSDDAQLVMTADWLSDGVGWAAALDAEAGPNAEALEAYLQAVAEVYRTHRIFPSHSDPAIKSHPDVPLLHAPFPRFRPLLSMVRSPPLLQVWASLPETQRASIATHSMELLVYDTLRRERCSAGGPSPMELIFEAVRTAPHIAVDTTLGSEVLTGVLVAEFSAPDRDFLLDAMAVLQLAVDQGDRRESELLMVREVVELEPHLQRLGLGLRVLRALRDENVVSQEVFQLWHECVGRFAGFPPPLGGRPAMGHFPGGGAPFAHMDEFNRSPPRPGPGMDPNLLFLQGPQQPLAAPAGMMPPQGMAYPAGLQTPPPPGPYNGGLQSEHSTPMLRPQMYPAGSGGGGMPPPLPAGPGPAGAYHHFGPPPGPGMPSFSAATGVAVGGPMGSPSPPSQGPTPYAAGGVAHHGYQQQQQPYAFGAPPQGRGGFMPRRTPPPRGSTRHNNHSSGNNNAYAPPMAPPFGTPGPDQGPYSQQHTS